MARYGTHADMYSPSISRSFLCPWNVCEARERIFCFGALLHFVRWSPSQGADITETPVGHDRAGNCRHRACNARAFVLRKWRKQSAFDVSDSLYCSNYHTVLLVRSLCCTFAINPNGLDADARSLLLCVQALQVAVELFEHKMTAIIHAGMTDDAVSLFLREIRCATGPLHSVVHKVRQLAAL